MASKRTAPSPSTSLAAARDELPTEAKKAKPISFAAKKPAIAMSLGAKTKGIKMSLTAKEAEDKPLPKPAAAAFADSDSEEEEMPAECRMRMKNLGKSTKISAGGPNSFGKKAGFGFRDPRHQNDHVLKAITDDLDRKHGAKR